MTLSSHRVVQLASLGETLASKARIARKCERNLIRIGNRIGADNHGLKAKRCERLLRIIRGRGIDF